LRNFVIINISKKLIYLCMHFIYIYNIPLVWRHPYICPLFIYLYSDFCLIRYLNNRCYQLTHTPPRNNVDHRIKADDGINVDRHSKPCNKCKYYIQYLSLFRGFECWFRSFPWSTLIPRWEPSLYIFIYFVIPYWNIYNSNLYPRKIQLYFNPNFGLIFSSSGWERTFYSILIIYTVMLSSYCAYYIYICICMYIDIYISHIYINKFTYI
jgi:hypothetical protein